MEYDKIKQLIEDIGNSKLTSVEIDFPDGTKISMKKEVPQIINNANLSNVAENINFENTEEQNRASLIETNIKRNMEKEAENNLSTNINNANKVESENINIIKSPMVGTFYLKPSPTAEPFIKIGENVKKGKTVCIIEAMKLMNEIESEFDGQIVEIYVKDGDVVEYGTELFGIK